MHALRFPRLSTKSLGSLLHRLNVQRSKPLATLSMSTPLASTFASSSTPVPRAGVSVVIRFACASNPKENPKFLLIERGNPPNKGMWCVPGGKVELGETSLEGAKREVSEEVSFLDKKIQLAWYSGGPFFTSDSITSKDTPEGKSVTHYVIGQCFAEVVNTETSSYNEQQQQQQQQQPPEAQASDDAAAAKWFTLEEIQEAEKKEETVPNLYVVMERAEHLYRNGMLPTTVSV